MASGETLAAPTLRARFRRSLGYRGLGRTLRVGGALAAYRLRRGLAAPRPHAFDLEFGTDTVSLTGGETVAGATAGNGHEPIDPVDFAQIMAALAIEHQRFDFIDFGSGQGRALMLAAAYPFARVIGIEYARELHESALGNLERWRRRGAQRAGEVASVWADAAAWELPHRPAVYYFCEPFQEVMMRRMAARLRASLEGAPRPAYVLYVGDWFRPVWEQPGDFETLAAHYFDRVYRYRGAA
jgi:SAM-dependent methyltransferase